VNEPLKLAWIDGQLILEAHPPVNWEGESIEPDVEKFAGMLQAALGESVVAINWDIVREELGKARGMPVVVGLAADMPDATIAVPVATAMNEAAPTR